MKAIGSPVLGAGTHDEAWLQALIFAHPELLPISRIEPGFGAAVPVAREVACGHAYIDNLYLTPSGEIILAETKLWRNVQARREVVAQALAYVAALASWRQSFDNGVRPGIASTSLSNRCRRRWTKETSDPVSAQRKPDPTFPSLVSK